MILLETKEVSKKFGGLTALDSISVAISEGESLGLIGPNGAGKSTLLNVISGFYPPSSGQVLFKGKDITGLKSASIAKKGIMRTFQANALFKDMTVLENLKLGFHIHLKANLLEQIVSTAAERREEDMAMRDAVGILEFWGLSPFKDELAGKLPHGHQRALGIAIATAHKPEVLLLDEPFSGMTADETSGMIRRIKEKGLTVILVEHNMRAVSEFCDRLVVLNYGRKIADGLRGEVVSNKEVIEAYLGKDDRG